MIGLSHIEWIFELNAWQENPIASESGVRDIREAVQETGIQINSVCADYFMERSYLRSGSRDQMELSEKLEWLVVQTEKIGGKFIDLPFVDEAAIRSRREFSAVRQFVALAAQRAETLGIIIALETSLSPDDFRELLESVKQPTIMANYDTGNSASLGYEFDEEWASYGKWIRTIHIKDRALHGPTVPLGTGNAPFKQVFARLRHGNFSGPMVLQAARNGDEVETAKENMRFVQRYYS